jgi:ribosome-associated protein
MCVNSPKLSYLEMPAKKKTAAPTATVAKKAPAAKKSPAKKAAKPAKAAAVPVEEAPAYQPVGLELAKLAAHYADNKKATDIVILDVREISMVTDFYVLCSGNSLPQLRAIRKEVADMLWLNHDSRANRLDGQPESGWVVVDFFDVVVHIFQQDKREVFALEDLWSDAPRIPFTPSTK